jgi:hypothetical protein
MNRTNDFIRFILISPEIVWAGLMLISYLYLSDYLLLLGEQFKSNSDLWKMLYALPFGFLVASFKATGNLRSPLDKEENKILYEWSMYTKITDRAIYSLILGIVCCSGVILIWVFSSKLSEELLGALYLSFTGISGISAFILILSAQTLKELLTKHT